MQLHYYAHGQSEASYITTSVTKNTKAIANLLAIRNKYLLALSYRREMKISIIYINIIYAILQALTPLGGVYRIS